MPDFAGSKTQNPRCRQRQRGSKTKKGTNATANPSYVLRKIFLPQLLYIVYQIFRRAQIFVGFFCNCGRPGAAGGTSPIVPVRFGLTGSAAGKYRGKHNCYFAGQKEAPHSRHFRLHSKNFCLQGLFPSACSMHAFISAASVLKSFFRTASTSSSLCRPNFR